jgi:hypothetical protein
VDGQAGGAGAGERQRGDERVFLLLHEAVSFVVCSDGSTFAPMQSVSRAASYISNTNKIRTYAPVI